MRNPLNLLISVVIVAVLAAYMCTFTVRYDETAVRTVLEKASSDDLLTEPGLYLSLPWPAGKVHKYPQKLQVLEDVDQQLQTRDSFSVIVRAFVTWRVSDPYQFFQSVRDLEKAANENIKPTIPDVLSQVLGRYAFSDLVNTDPQRVKLPQIEQEITEALAGRIAALNIGVKVEHVGLRRLVLPETVTEKVFESMRSTREALAKNAEQEGQARAQQITSEAQSVGERIMAFANSTATAIRAEGQQEAARQFDVFAQDPELAIFLRKIDTLKQVLGYRTTFILDPNSTDFLDLLRDEKTPGTTRTVEGPRPPLRNE
jgi:membrane protease subunit HflC